MCNRILRAGKLFCRSEGSEILGFCGKQRNFDYIWNVGMNNEEVFHGTVDSDDLMQILALIKVEIEDFLGRVCLMGFKLKFGFDDL